ncbi:MAG: guanylate kinase [bacterium]|nr:guanylate kinase [bacterium]
MTDTVRQDCTSRGNLFVISSVSGGGKTTLIRKILGSVPGVRLAVSHTTRAPRPEEKDGEDYHFITRDRFRTMIHEDRFLEWAEVYGKYYGTSVDAVDSVSAGGCDVILDIDVQGAMQVRTKRPEAVLIFILPPSVEEQERRLRGRGTEDEDDVGRRLEAARQELAFASEYDYSVVNDNLNEAVEAVRYIIEDHRCKSGTVES